jgi:hypothetical protein
MKTVLEFFKSVRNSISKLFGKTAHSAQSAHSENTTSLQMIKPTIEETHDITQETQNPLKIEETKFVVNQKTEETKTESKPQKVSKPKNTKAKTSKNTKAKTSENAKAKASENKSVKKRGRPRKTV